MNPLRKIKEILLWKAKRITVWKGSFIYPDTILGKNISIGRQCEIGADSIGDNTRIGYHTFIPKGVHIGSDCFIGPMVCFTNDMYPPSPKSKWEKTSVDNGAAIGAGCIIRPGVHIGENALIGCGSVVTKNVPPGEVWVGNPARFIRKVRKNEYP